MRLRVRASRPADHGRTLKPRAASRPARSQISRVNGDTPFNSVVESPRPCLRCLALDTHLEVRRLLSLAQVRVNRKAEPKFRMLPLGELLTSYSIVPFLFLV